MSFLFKISQSADCGTSSSEDFNDNSMAETSKMKEDSVDVEYYGTRGAIKAERGELCRHARHSKCSHCLDRDPWDEVYLQSKEIKHKSFHAELKRLTQKSGGGKSVAYPLENIVCTVDRTCTMHEPYPAALCSRCQPGAVTLNRQTYRHVDYVQFESNSIVESFLEYWRRTGKQRVGFLIGRYVKYDDVPLGIKAVVTAIYEPPQENGARGVRLLDDPQSRHVDEMNALLGLSRVGWVFTDLQAAAGDQVAFVRTADSFLLTAEECITAGALQNTYKNACRYAKEQHFGSKFATVVVTGDASNAIQMVGYQVSNQCASLVDAQLVVPVNGRPELAYVRPRNRLAFVDQYVPEVQYKVKDKYGNEVTRDGRPLPVEYLMVDVPVGAPLQPEHSMAGNRIAYPIENRQSTGEEQMTFTGQDLASLGKYLTDNQSEDVSTVLSNWHLLYFVCTNNASMAANGSAISDTDLALLLRAVGSSDGDAINKFVHDCDAYSILVAEADAALNRQATQATNGDGGASSSGGGGGETWPCPSCTYLNSSGKGDCEMCGLPRHR